MTSSGNGEACPGCRSRDREIEQNRRSLAQLHATVDHLRRELSALNAQHLALSRRSVQLREATFDEERRRTRLMWDESSSGAAFRTWRSRLGTLDHYCEERSLAWVQAWAEAARDRVGRFPSLEEVRGPDATAISLRRTGLNRAGRRRLNDAVIDYNERLRLSFGPGRVELALAPPGPLVSQELGLHLHVTTPWTPEAIDACLRQWRKIAQEGPARQVRAHELPPLYYPRVPDPDPFAPPQVRAWHGRVRTGLVQG